MKLYQLEIILCYPNLMFESAKATLEGKVLEYNWEKRVFFTNKDSAMEYMKKELQNMKNILGDKKKKYFTDKIEDYGPESGWKEIICVCSNDRLVPKDSDIGVYELTLTILSEDLEKDSKNGLVTLSQF